MYRSDVDGLRAVAVLPVVLYHAGFPIVSGGFVGVDVFFVISGFLITSIIQREIAENRFSLISFYERRARRILPALTVVIFASLAIGWFVLLPGEMKSLGQSALSTALFISNVYFMLTLNYFSQAAEFAPLLHTWSLAVEEQFYLFFPLILVFIKWQQLKQPLWIVIFISLLSFLAAVVLLSRKPDWVFYLIFFRAWELGVGAMLALSALRPPQARMARELLAAVGLSGILIPVFVFDAATPFPAAAAFPPVIGATLLILVGAPGGGSMVNAALSKRAFVWVGLISYSLYLWHWPVLVYARVLMGTAVLPIEVGGAAVAISLIMAWLSFRFVERPFRAPSSNRLSRRSIFAASALSVMTVTGVGWFLHVSDGFPARLPASATAMAAFVDHGNARRADCFDRTPSEGLCAIGKSPDENNRVDFLFWGDSHADAFMPGVDWTADRLGQSGVFAGRSACPPIFDIERVSAGRDCTTFNESVWSWLESRVDAPLVILGARWTLSVEGTRYRGEAGGDVRLDWIGDPEARPVDADNAALVEAGLNATLHKLLATGRSVILLGPVPEVGRNVPVALARKALLGWAPGASVTRQDYDARASRTERILMRIAGSHAGVRYIPLSDLFCDARVCLTTTTDGQPLYVDDDHISHTAAISLLPPRLEDIWRAVER